MANTTISWQSAYFGLVAIALNTMTQPGGRICEFAAASRLFMRSSAVVCVADTIQMLVHLVSDLWEGDSFRDAMAHIVDDQFEGIDANEEDSLASLRRTTVTRWTVFLISGAPQIVKLFAFSGITWTKICAAAYVASWLVVDFLVVYSSVKHIVLSRHDSHLPGRFRGKHWGGLTFTKWLGILAVFVEKIFVKIVWFPVGGIGGSAMFAMFVASIFIFLIAFLQKISGDMLGESLPMVVASVTAAAAFVLAHISYWRYDFWTFLSASDGSTMFFGCASLFGISLLGLFALGEAEYLAPIGRFAFLLTTFLGALSYYATVYDSAGTYKPGWTNLLG
ncbi:hypothetical protein H2200_002263 [Cladophialophora chaetospira]|uniref:Uncharacterized protein n=1 Tax=Cladophialophora chaetospira TaxID=386627 RepID=A0AA38XIK5_9EURO|nr:hypothetical protein H2200_002263 [Cladophialophora chaetospira]